MSEEEQMARWTVLDRTSDEQGETTTWLVETEEPERSQPGDDNRQGQEQDRRTD